LVQVDLRDGVLVLGAKSGFVAEYLQQHLVNLLTAAAAHYDPSVRLVKVTAILE
jgi:DNA-binding MurR/RpiR family transcriptional regulator